MTPFDKDDVPYSSHAEYKADIRRLTGPTRQEVERAELRSLADTAASILRRHAEEEGFMDIDTQEWLMRYDELEAK